MTVWVKKPDHINELFTQGGSNGAGVHQRAPEKVVGVKYGTSCAVVYSPRDLKPRFRELRDSEYLELENRESENLERHRNTRERTGAKG